MAAEEGKLPMLVARLGAMRLNAFRLGYVVKRPVGRTAGSTPTHFVPVKTTDLPDTTTTTVLEP